MCLAVGLLWQQWGCAAPLRQDGGSLPAPWGGCGVVLGRAVAAGWLLWLLWWLGRRCRVLEGLELTLPAKRTDKSVRKGRDYGHLVGKVPGSGHLAGKVIVGSVPDV